MAFSPRSLVRQSVSAPVGSTAGAAQQQQVSYFIYATDDPAATVETAGYFNNARAILSKGDIISASMVNSGTPVRKGYIVTAVPTSGNVTVALTTTTAG